MPLPACRGGLTGSPVVWAPYGRLRAHSAERNAASRFGGECGLSLGELVLWSSVSGGDLGHCRTQLRGTRVHECFFRGEPSFEVLQNRHVDAQPV